MKARENAVIILNKWEQEKTYLNLNIKSMLNCSEEDKGLATELIYGVVRYRMTLDYIIFNFSKVKENRISVPVRNILRISLYQMMFLDKIPVSAACNEGVKLAYRFTNRGGVSFVNALLRKMSKLWNTVDFPKDETEYLMYKYSFPRDITEIFIRDFGISDAREIMKSLNENKGFSVRPNLLKTSSENLKEMFKNDNIDYRFEDGAFFVDKLPKGNGFNEGLYTFQGLASMKAAEMLNPCENETIGDFCSAPGGKTCYIAELMHNKGKIFSFDVYEHRLELVKNTCKRLGVTNVVTKLNDATVHNEEYDDKFDGILLDVPCSGLGVIAKKPDIKWNEKRYSEIIKTQYAILNSSKNYVKKGGRIVYSTCTVNKDENERIVKKFLSENNNFSLVGDYVTYLPSTTTDGFFMCKLERK